MIITFSGLDGSGKTTLIKYLENYYQTKKIKYDSYSIYGELSVYAIIRNLKSLYSYSSTSNTSEEKKSKMLSYKFFRSKQSKKLFLIFDIIFLHVIKIYYRLINRVLIIDRYFFDFLMEITSEIKVYQRVVCALFPEPDLSFFIDTDPKISFERKGEYDISTLKERRKIYDLIFQHRPVDYIINNNDSNAKSELLQIIKSMGK